MRARLPSIENVGSDSSVRLNLAAALAFPEGSMSERHGYAHDVADDSRCGWHSFRACEPLNSGKCGLERHGAARIGIAG
jgi:hypothetical protein